jgi:ABC-type transport system substrate-binding protein
VLGAWTVPVFSIDYYQLWHSSQADLPQSSNMCGFKNAEVDELADKLRTTFDLDDRMKIIKRIQAVLYEEQPYTFYKAYETIFVWRNRGDRAVLGMDRNLDEIHPLLNRDPRYRVFWHF